MLVSKERVQRLEMNVSKIEAQIKLLENELGMIHEMLKEMKEEKEATYFR